MCSLPLLPRLLAPSAFSSLLLCFGLESLSFFLFFAACWTPLRDGEGRQREKELRRGGRVPGWG
jgi:hypothetical protein